MIRPARVVVSLLLFAAAGGLVWYGEVRPRAQGGAGADLAADGGAGGNAGAETNALPRPAATGTGGDAPKVVGPPPGAADLAGSAREIGTWDEATVAARLRALPAWELGGEGAELLVRRWVALNPRAAAPWLGAVTEAEVRAALSVAAAQVWADQDLPGALAWGRALPPDFVQERVQLSLGFELARTEPLPALRMAADLPPSEGRDDLVVHALQEWTVQDANAALGWALQMAPGTLRDTGLAAAAVALAKQDGERAARLAVTELPPGPEQDRTVVAVLQRWVQKDRTAALAWWGSFPPSPLRTQAAAALAGIISDGP